MARIVITSYSIHYTKLYDLAICASMVICGAGFGLFQSPNNHTIISSAPRHRSGGASGMLGTARLVGQTSGAALVALAFNFFPASGTHASLIAASYNFV